MYIFAFWTAQFERRNGRKHGSCPHVHVDHQPTPRR